MQALKMQPLQTQCRLALFTFVLAFCVILVGADVRLSDAGFGCPDWPGCYGKMVAPADQTVIDAGFNGRPLDSGKAWKEIIHRYLAGTLGVAILLLAVIAWRLRKQDHQPLLLPSILLLLVIFQAALLLLTLISIFWFTRSHE